MSAVKKNRQVKGSTKKHVQQSNPMRSRKGTKGKRLVFARTGDGGPTGAGEGNG